MTSAVPGMVWFAALLRSVLIAPIDGVCEKERIAGADPKRIRENESAGEIIIHRSRCSELWGTENHEREKAEGRQFVEANTCNLPRHKLKPMARAEALLLHMI